MRLMEVFYGPWVELLAWSVPWKVTNELFALPWELLADGRPGMVLLALPFLEFIFAVDDFYAAAET